MLRPGRHVRDAVEGAVGGFHRAPKSTKISTFPTSCGCRLGTVSDPDGMPTGTDTGIRFRHSEPKTRARAELAIPGAWGCCGPAGSCRLHVRHMEEGGGLGGPPGAKIHQNLEIFDFLAVPPGSQIRPRWGANGHRNRFFGSQMATFCVRSAPSSPGARCICIGAAVDAGIRFRHSEPKTCARAELAIPGAWGCCGPAG
eukprot:gene17465-biopygen14407